ncbi:hypothetical protein ILUMI_04393 [Ignelater luminosus]|uniref:Transposase n=1 Tax=Ignelater luminosus TaxID=2038154 RepID=A0A8K0GHE1_IGNLU|nr:hypothetical protein ILUMI_04393 [Ignelater luminosus]
MNYIVKEMRPICIVEKPAFVKLVEGLSGKKPCDRKTLRSKLEAAKSTVIGHIKEELAKTKYVCTTADIWSAQNKSYLDVTVHFIDDKNFERKSFVLCCKRFKSSHCFDKIAGVINKVHTFYDLKIDKISGTVTDNARNFSKAFNVFSMSLSDTNVNNDNDNFAEFPELENGKEVNIETLPYFDEEATYILLPQQFRCCSHILNLIITIDAQKAKEDQKYKKISSSVFKKSISNM